MTFTPVTITLTLILAGAILFSLVASAVLLFHWRRYGLSGGVIRFAETIHILISAGLILFAIVLFMLLI